MLYTGREWDAAARLYNYRFRWYSPTLGRFTSRDPIGYGGGLNQYMYVDGNPVFWSDPLGLSAKVPWNPLTWLDSDGSERVTDPRSWWTFGGAGQGDAFVEGAAQGHIGWSNGFLHTMSFGFAENYSDRCNKYQRFGSFWGTVSGVASQSALFASGTRGYSAWRSKHLPEQLYHHTTTSGAQGILAQGGGVESVRASAGIWGKGGYFTSLRNLNWGGRLVTGVRSSNAVLGFSKAMTDGRLNWVAPTIYRTGAPTSGGQGGLLILISQLIRNSWEVSEMEDNCECP